MTTVVLHNPSIAKPQHRRSRYVRHPESAPAAIVGIKLDILEQVQAFRVMTMPQIARLFDLPMKTAGRYMRGLFDAGMVQVVAMPRALLAGPDITNALQLAFGSAPNIYTASRKSIRYLLETGRVQNPSMALHVGPRNTMLAHQLLIGDVRIWLAVSAKENKQLSLVRWVEGHDARITLTNNKPRQCVNPDAWFVHQIGGRYLIGLLEADRGTERGMVRWQEKIDGYQALFQGNRLKEITGFQHARVIVVTLNSRRRDRLAEIISKATSPDMAGRYWIAEQSALYSLGLREPVWRQAGSDLLRPLVTAEVQSDNTKPTREASRETN